MTFSIIQYKHNQEQRQMIKIAIIDDNEDILKKVESLTKHHMQALNSPFQIHPYTNPSALISSTHDGERFDIYLLDVEMPECSGFEVAKTIRKYQPVAVIIFLTSYLEYATKGYTVHALRYILKPNMDEELPEALEVALNSLTNANNTCLMISHYNNITRVLYEDIVYVKKSHRILQIFTMKQGVLSDNRGIKEVFEMLHDPRFTFIERSCFINLDYAHAIDRGWMVMKDGERLPISRPMIPKVKDAIMRLWGG